MISPSEHIRLTVWLLKVEAYVRVSLYDVLNGHGRGQFLHQHCVALTVRMNKRDLIVLVSHAGMIEGQLDKMTNTGLLASF